MSLRNINKDYLAEHMEQEPGSLTVVMTGTELPDHEDPLRFWTLHPQENILIDLTPFACGQSEARKKGRLTKGPYSGRPRLILQLAPAIRANLLGKARGTIQRAMDSLRAWWRLLDGVEDRAALSGVPMDRVEDVRQLTGAHYTCALGQVPGVEGIAGGRIKPFRYWVNLVRRSLREPTLHWPVSRDASSTLRLPPEDQCTDLRIALKQEWYGVLRRWQKMDSVKANGFHPANAEDQGLSKHWCWFQDTQRRTGKVLPSFDELRNGIASSYFAQKTGLNLATMCSLVFPSRWDVDTAFHQCLVNTGWNASTMLSLNALATFLSDNDWDPARYTLVGSKARADGKEQVVDGLWKTSYGPGYIIRQLLERTAPLRIQLQDTLAAERTAYVRMQRTDTSVDDLTRQLNVIQTIEEGCRSVWLYVDVNGEINWLSGAQAGAYTQGDGKPKLYLTVFLRLLNKSRKSVGKAEIPRVTPRDFRNMFATYVWRISGGNLLDVMAALNHAWLQTTDDYLNQNILNQERDATILTFLNLLFAQLGVGRLDLTILAHQLRYGALTPEMEQRLAEYRALPHAWPGIACKDPRHPPKKIHDTSRVPVCSGERCLLCTTNAVILPEALETVARRVEELIAYRSAVPIAAFQGAPADELANGLLVLKLFPLDEVEKARANWVSAIESGQHRVPGLRLRAERRIA